MPQTSDSESRLKSNIHPVLYEINIRVMLNELSSQQGKKVTLDTIPDAVLDAWADLRVDAVWLMGVWSVGKLGVKIAREVPGLRQEYAKTLHDVTDEDVIGSPYAVGAYSVSRSLGGVKALRALRKKLHSRGIGLVLDFVSNHTARDHRWVNAHPEYYVQGAQNDAREKPDQYYAAKTVQGERAIAFGRDPYFPSWTDTAQLNPMYPQARKAMIATLMKIAEECDGVRCDMAMLILNDVFKKTWGDSVIQSDEEEFWTAAIQAVRTKHPEFLFIAETYWNLEWPLQQLGFDYTYDKTLYERLLREGAGAVHDHLKAEMEYQQHSARFIENHDEPRIAHVLTSDSWHFAAATIVATIPGMLLLHEGQLEGRTVKVPVQLGRRPAELLSPTTQAFYKKLLLHIDHDVIKRGVWGLSALRPAWHDNYSHQNILAYSWRYEQHLRCIVVNYAPLNSQCYVDWNLEGIDGTAFEFRDLLNAAAYVRDRVPLQSRGMYFDLPGYGVHLFEVKAVR